jgi:hypothetical protein
MDADDSTVRPVDKPSNRIVVEQPAAAAATAARAGLVYGDIAPQEIADEVVPEVTGEHGKTENVIGVPQFRRNPGVHTEVFVKYIWNQLGLHHFKGLRIRLDFNERRLTRSQSETNVN